MIVTRASDVPWFDPMIAALILGREGSQGFPGKNVFPILGRPLMAYPILAARHAPSVDRVFVSTDSSRIKSIALQYGADVIPRPTVLATKEALGEDAFAHGYREIVRRHGPVEFMVLMFCNAPALLPVVIEKGVEVLRRDSSLDSAVSVSRYNMWSPLRARRVGEDGLLHPFVPFETFGDPRTLNCDRDSQGDVWFADMGVSVVRPRCLDQLAEGLLPQRWMGRKIHPLFQEAGCDVDYEWQIPGIIDWLQRQGFGPEKSPYDR